MYIYMDQVNDRFWRDARGQSPSYLGEEEYAGNEAATRNSRYQCCLLAFACRRSTARGPSEPAAAAAGAV
jgi:hypothetical protein